jgi:LacI family transcriptional regulator
MATILEIARLANVSCSTVSRALNGRKGVGEKMRARIIELARELDYYPNSTAQALVNQRLGVLGLIIPRTSEYTFSSPYYSHMLLGISTVATRQGYQIMLVLNEQKSYAAFYHRRMVDGILVVGNSFDDPKVFDLTDRGIPSVVVPGFIKNSARNPISINGENHQSNYQAVSHLIELNHRRIAFILGRTNSKYSVERYEAYREALKDHGLEFRPEYISYSDFSAADGYRIMGEMLDLPQPPTAVLFTNDSLSIGGLDRIKSRRLKIPEQLSVVATCTSDLLARFDPPLTMVQVPVVAVGRAAAQSLIQLIETGIAPQDDHSLASSFVVKKSTGPCPAP